ncbi:MAG: hypothetical protein Ta2F_18360 [Termitinemataceae bacterium]|nr:MAG: hypothetical protein Ta2F_18360 [Termitinemataceae bacterium]
MNSYFRTIDQWKAALLRLSDDIFFELVRSVLGDIRSPFHKQNVIENLAAVLSKSDVQKTIAAYIDETDHKIIASVAALNEPTEADLENFFSGELSYTDVHLKVLNLEERLILYGVAKKDSEVYLSLNPLLKKILTPFTSDISILFTEKKLDAAMSKSTSASLAPCDDGLDLRFAFFTALVFGENNFWTSEGLLKKKHLCKNK